MLRQFGYLVCLCLLLFRQSAKGLVCQPELVSRPCPLQVAHGECVAPRANCDAEVANSIEHAVSRNVNRWAVPGRGSRQVKLPPVAAQRVLAAIVSVRQMPLSRLLCRVVVCSRYVVGRGPHSESENAGQLITVWTRTDSRKLPCENDVPALWLHTVRASHHSSHGMAVTDSNTYLSLIVLMLPAALINK